MKVNTEKKYSQTGGISLDIDYTNLGNGQNEEYLNLYCQSCCMPMQSADQFGTNADGSANQEYCCYCYKNGEFVQDCTMDEMIDHCIKHLDEFNGASSTQYTKEQAIAEMKKHFPTLKRWKEMKS